MADPPLGRYAYGVVPSAARLELEDLRGVDGAHPIEVVEQDGLAAITSAVELTDYGEEGLRRHLEDLAWVDRTARAHDAVLDRALATAAVVPLRLCTIFESEAHVRAMLEREHDALRAALERLSGRSEWGVKVLADPAALRAAAVQRSPELARRSAEAEGQSTGRAYLARKGLEQEVVDETRRIAADAAREVHEAVSAHAAAARVLPVQQRELAGYTGDMLLNAAYLVDADRAGEIRALAQELGERHRDLGLSLQTTGPWAPYNFAAAER